MRIFHTLHFRIPALVLLVGLVLIALGYVRNVRWRTERRLEFLRNDAHAEGTRLSGMAQHLFRKKLVRTADLEMSYASAAPELELGVICDSDDVVRNATRLQWKGVRLDDTPLRVVRPWVAEVKKSMGGQIYKDEIGKKLLAVFPFRDGEGDSAGIVALSYDLGGPVAEASRFALQETVPQGLALAAGCMLIWGAMHLLVTVRVDNLLAYARSVSAGETPELPPLGDDEIGDVGRGMSEAVEKIIRVESRLLEAGEVERLTIGRDLHDDVCQRITAAQLRIGMMGAALAAEGSSQARMAGEIEAEMSKTAQIARGFARGLAPVALDVQGLDTAIAELGNFLQSSFGIRCELQCDGAIESCDREGKVHLYRIAQELATNAAKHAKGSFVSIRLKSEQEGIQMVVENDGIDFEETGAGGLGLQFVRQRVRALHGRMTIGRREHGLSGTVVVVDMPVNKNAREPLPTHEQDPKQSA
jgi:signal transduction histidine kinase